MLRGAAENFAKTWKFDLPKSMPADAEPYNATIQFKIIHGTVDPRNAASLSVRRDSYRHIDVVALVSDTQLSECPTGTDEDVPPQLAQNDFVEVSRSGCYGSCPNYSVKIRADGSVTWNGFEYVEVKGRGETTINAATARDLIERFRTKQFWSLCGSYTRSITDSVTTTVTVKLGGRLRSVTDYADSAPAEVESLVRAIDEVSNSHQWRHGDPVKEPITRLSPDSYLPKPGVTPLMQAAANADLGKLRAMIIAGGDVSQTDASGWSALTYAAAGHSAKSVELLLRAGADPNHASFRGDTELMASASEGQWDGDLVKAGAKVNAQNVEGQTALMFLAAQAEVDEIREALKVGANSQLRDIKGRTAVDYLYLTSCGKSPLSDPLTNGWMTIGYSRCNVLDSDDVRAARKILSRARGLTK